MGNINASAFFSISYGLYVLSTKEGSKDNACIINTAQLLTDSPKRITVAINKSNLTEKMIRKSGLLNVSVLTKKAPMTLFERFGFRSGRNVDKFYGFTGIKRSENGLYYVSDFTNAYISAKVTDAHDYHTHTLFVCEATESASLSDEDSATYDYYSKHIKPSAETVKKKGFICSVCGYIYTGETLPSDYSCPVCKHGAEVFIPLL